MKKNPLLLVILLHLLAHVPTTQADSAETKVDTVFAPWDSTSSPGCALAVIQGGDIVYSHGYGMADMEHGVAISPSSVFYVGSVSKHGLRLQAVRGYEYRPSRRRSEALAR
jgi:CubicO group peptidase (beta-lactamase class C family)